MKIGVILPLGEIENSGQPLAYSEIRDRAQQAEALGFDSLWLYDHLLHRFPERQTVGFHECWTILSALAEATRKPELGTQVLCTAFRNPALLAKMAATLEEVSNGRLILGLGAGWHKPEFDAYGFPFDHLASRFEDALKIIVPLLSEGHVDFAGTYYQAKNCELRPRGPRPKGPQIMVASVGPRMLRLTAQHAHSWNTDWIGSLELFSERKRALEAACLQVGRNPATLEMTGGVTIGYPKLGKLPSWMVSPDQYLSGSPEEVAKGLSMYADWGISHIMCAYYPNTSAALNNLGEAVHAYRAKLY